MTDQDVIDLYRCLLARAPEADDTVAAFRAYYPDFARGRQAILASAEFREVYDAAVGAPVARIGQAFLRRAGGVVALPDESETALTGAMRLVLRAHGAVRVAVVLGLAEAALGTLLPGLPAQAAVLHVADAFPPVLPQIGVLPEGACVFRAALDPAALAALMREAGQTIDVLIAGPGRAADITVLRPVLSAAAVLLGVPALPAEIDTWPDVEMPPAPAGAALRFRGGWFLPVRYAPAADMTEPEGPIPGLCVAAIVRNEEEALPNMLRSMAPVAAYFVVADTGSADATRARAQDTLAALGRPHTLFDLPAGRFDVMRNAALDRAPPGTAWVLMLDADEEFCAEDRAALRALLACAEADAYSLPRYNFTGPDKDGLVAPYPDRQVRLLRVRAEAPLRYEGAVHETVRCGKLVRLPLDAQALGGGRGGPHIHHLVRRFRTPAQEAVKQAHYRAIAAEHGA